VFVLSIQSIRFIGSLDNLSIDSGLDSNSTVRSVLLIDNVAVHAKLASSLIPLSYVYYTVCMRLSFKIHSWLHSASRSERLLCLRTPDISIILAMVPFVSAMSWYLSLAHTLTYQQ
jgi:hypothetical protein